MDQLQTNTEVKKGIVLEPETFDVRQYGGLRLEYRLTLADVNYRDYAIGIEAANVLQNAVNIVVAGGDKLPPKQNLNKFQLEQELNRLKEQKLEIKRNEKLQKRKNELKKILASGTLPAQNSSQVKLDSNVTPTKQPDFTIKRTSSATKQQDYNKSLMGSLNKSYAGHLESSSSQILRTPKYLAELKAKAEDIKRRREEVKSNADRERTKQQELMMFIKKKKNKEFIGSKVNLYDKQFSNIFKTRYENEHKQKLEVKKVNEEISKELKEAAEIHAADIEERKKEMDELNKLYQACEVEITKENSDTLQTLKSTFFKYNKMQDPWTILNDERFSNLLSNKLVQKLFTDSKVVPELLSLKRMVELIGKSVKRQQNSLFLTFDEFKILCYDIAIDSCRYGVKDPYFARSRRTTQPPKSPIANIDRLNTFNSSQTMLKKPMLPGGYKEETLITSNLASPLSRAFKVEPTLSMQKSTLGRAHTAAVDQGAVIESCAKILSMFEHNILNRVSS